MNRSVLAIFLGFYPLFNACAEEIIPSVLYPGGARVGGYSKFVVDGQGYVLPANTDIHADEVEINGTLVTNGYRLVIDAQKIRFGHDGRIQAFNAQAPAGAMGAPGPDGHMGGAGIDKHKLKAMRNGKRGGTPAETGRPGSQGADGMANPQAITMFGAMVEGRAVIDATGQTGGAGGRGGPGGRGGAGGPGGKGESSCFFFIERDGGQGGDGGGGGIGGRGGAGGRGGKAAAVNSFFGFFDAHSNNKQVAPLLVGAPGTGGAGGPGGDAGGGGEPGRGGTGDTAFCVFFKLSSKHGSSGTAGPAGRGGPVGGAGANGVGSEINFKTFNALEKQRAITQNSWFRFHIQRTLYSLLEDSLRLATTSSVTRAQIEKMLVDDAGNADIIEMLRSADNGYIEKIVSAWREHFINPVRELTEESQKSRFTTLARLALAQAEGAVALVEKLKTSDNLSAVIDELRERVGISRLQVAGCLNQAMSYCNKYNAVKHAASLELLQNIFGISDHYALGACRKDAGFERPGNIFQEIKMGFSVDHDLSSPHVRSLISTVKARIPVELVSKNGLFSRIFAVFNEVLGINHAYADQDDVIIVGSSRLDPKSIVATLPAVDRLNESAGMVKGYVVPDEKDVNINNLAIHLRSLGLLLGVKK